MNMTTKLVYVAVAIVLTAKFNDGFAIENTDPQERNIGMERNQKALEEIGKYYSLCFHLLNTFGLVI